MKNKIVRTIQEILEIPLLIILIIRHFFSRLYIKKRNKKRKHTHTVLCII